MRDEYGYNRNVKIAVSVPDMAYRDVEIAAKALGISRSRLCARAISEFLARHKQANVKAQLDEVYGAESAKVDKMVIRIQSLCPPREEW